MTTKKKVAAKRGPYAKKSKRRSVSATQEIIEVPEGMELFKVEDNVLMNAKATRVESDKIRQLVDDTIKDMRVGQSFVIRKINWDVARAHISKHPSGMIFRSTLAKENKNFVRFWRVK